jgi:hypothetical protein
MYKECAGNIFLRLTENLHIQQYVVRCTWNFISLYKLNDGMGNDWWQLAAVIRNVIFYKYLVCSYFYSVIKIALALQFGTYIIHKSAVLLRFLEWTK